VCLLLLKPDDKREKSELVLLRLREIRRRTIRNGGNVLGFFTFSVSPVAY
jgi:hypothetical protein